MSITATIQNYNQNIINKSFICLKTFALTEKDNVMKYVNKQHDRDKYFVKVNWKKEISLYKYV